MEEIEIKDKKEYEIGFLVKNEADAQAIKQLLIQQGSEIINEGFPKEINLAYKIKKEAKAWFGFFRFQSEPAVALALKNDLRTFPNLLRFLILRLPKKASPAQIPVPKKKKLAKLLPRLKEKSQTEGKPSLLSLSNEEIEKKIEEILQ